MLMCINDPNIVELYVDVDFKMVQEMIDKGYIDEIPYKIREIYR